jgi:hypothetical protein
MASLKLPVVGIVGNLTVQTPLAPSMGQALPEEANTFSTTS